MNKNSNIFKKIDNAVYVTALLFAIIIIFVSIILVMTKVIEDADDSYKSETTPYSETLGTMSTIVSVMVCGNAIQEDPEDCDGIDLDSQTCQTLGFDSGTLSCNTNCSFDTSSCTIYTPSCGNDIKEVGEECDGADLGNMTCITFGYTGGTLSCYSNCTYNRSICYLSQPSEPSPPSEEEPEEVEDSDNDGLPDWWEDQYSCMQKLINDAVLDYDDDNLSNRNEFANDTDPCNSDTDGDGMPDGWEVKYSLDPLRDDSNEDPDSDSFTNIEEYKSGTNPHISNKPEEPLESQTVTDREKIKISKYAKWIGPIIAVTISLTATFIIIITVKRETKKFGYDD